MLDSNAREYQDDRDHNEPIRVIAGARRVRRRWAAPTPGARPAGNFLVRPFGDLEGCENVEAGGRLDSGVNLRRLRRIRIRQVLDTAVFRIIVYRGIEETLRDFIFLKCPRIVGVYDEPP